MRQLRRTLQLKDGVGVDILLTPHLFSYQQEKGIKLETDGTTTTVMEVYADIYYLAAINAWELDGHGTAEEFPYTRGDFHEYATSSPKAFAKDIDFAVSALTGKTTEELIAEREKSENSGTAEPVGGKKKASGWIGRKLKRSS